MEKIITFEEEMMPKPDWWTADEGGSGEWYEVTLSDLGKENYDALLQQCGADCISYYNVPVSYNTDAAPFKKRPDRAGYELVNVHGVRGGF